jgi:hypothetical protein
MSSRIAALRVSFKKLLAEQRGIGNWQNFGSHDLMVGFDTRDVAIADNMLCLQES